MAIDWGDTLPTVAAALGGGGLMTAYMNNRTVRAVEAVKAKAAATANKLEEQKVRLDEKRTLNEAFDRLSAENARLYQRIEALEDMLKQQDAATTEIARLYARIETLEARLGQDSEGGTQ